MALSACLWWVYFGGDDDQAEQALLAATPSRRSVLAIEAYGDAHLAILLGIWVSAVAQLGGLVAIFLLLFVVESLRARSQSAGLASVAD